jgi:hypothetical protein
VAIASPPRRRARTRRASPALQRDLVRQHEFLAGIALAVVLMALAEAAMAFLGDLGRWRLAITLPLLLASAAVALDSARRWRRATAPQS